MKHTYSTVQSMVIGLASVGFLCLKARRLFKDLPLKETAKQNEHEGNGVQARVRELDQVRIATYDLYLETDSARVSVSDPLFVGLLDNVDNIRPGDVGMLYQSSDTGRRYAIFVTDRYRITGWIKSWRIW
jgi:hypothetical protein